MSLFINDQLSLQEVQQLAQKDGTGFKDRVVMTKSEALHGKLQTWANGTSGETEAGAGSQRGRETGVRRRGCT